MRYCTISENTEKALSHDKTRFTHPRWNSESLPALIRRIAAEFHLKPSCITPVLDKILVYQPGDAFLLFDNEKQDLQNSVFAKLVIQLPSQYTGGCLTLEHTYKGLQRNDFGDSTALAPFRTYFACFLNDIPHQMHPITSGIRALVLYDLQWSDMAMPKLTSAKLTQKGRELANIFQEWDCGNDFVLFPLELNVL